MEEEFVRMKWHNCRQWFLNLQNFSPEQSCKTPLLLASIPVDISGKDQNQLMILASTTRVDKVISTQEGFVDQWSEKRLGLKIEALPLAIYKIGAGE